jgi:hypothetical protein
MAKPYGIHAREPKPPQLPWSQSELGIACEAPAHARRIPVIRQEPSSCNDPATH